MSPEHARQLQQLVGLAIVITGLFWFDLNGRLNRLKEAIRDNEVEHGRFRLRIRAELDRITGLPAVKPKETETMARRPLTREQLNECLASGGNTCPRCGHDDFEAEDLKTGDGLDATQVIECSECGERLKLTYTLARVEPAD